MNHKNIKSQESVSEKSKKIKWYNLNKEKPLKSYDAFKGFYRM